MIAFNDMIADMFNNRKFKPILTELFMKSRKINTQPAHNILGTSSEGSLKDLTSGPLGNFQGTLREPIQILVI